MNTTEASAQSPKDTKLEEFDLVILGGGTGSTIAAWTFAKQGQREQEYLNHFSFHLQLFPFLCIFLP